MSNNPKGRREDTKKIEKNLREAEPPVGKQDPTQPVDVNNNRGKKGNTASDPHVQL